MPAYNQGKWDMALPQVVPFHFYFPVWQKGLVVRGKYALDAFGLSPNSASGELCSLLRMRDLTS